MNEREKQIARDLKMLALSINAQPFSRVLTDAADALLSLSREVERERAFKDDYYKRWQEAGDMAEQRLKLLSYVDQRLERLTKQLGIE